MSSVPDTTPVSGSTVAEAVERLESLLAGGRATAVDTETVQRLLRVAVELYYRRREAGLDHGPFAASADVAATAVLVAATNMLQYAEIEPFEMAMWMNRAS